MLISMANFAAKKITMNISIGADHAGYELKAHLKEAMKDQNIEWCDHGTNGPESVDYPDFGHEVCKDVLEGRAKLGVLICGSANGMTMTANKHQDIRCALCWLPEIASLARQHNNANVIALPARFISNAEGLEILKAFLEAEFEGGRHQRRVDKIACS